MVFSFKIPTSSQISPARPVTRVLNVQCPIFCLSLIHILPERTRRYVTREGEYFLGAQGGDVFYLYKMREGQKNLGKYLHRKNVYMVFCNFLEAARSGDGCVTSYIAGYITHYAGDIVFHPYVYSLLNRLEFEDTGNWKGNRHAPVSYTHLL